VENKKGKPCGAKKKKCVKVGGHGDEFLCRSKEVRKTLGMSPFAGKGVTAAEKEGFEEERDPDETFKGDSPSEIRRNS